MIKTVLLVLLAGLLGGTGHVLLAKAMKTVGDLTEAPAAYLGGMVLRALGELARDLGVHPLAGIVERGRPEPGQHEWRDTGDGEDCRQERRGPLAQVRDTRNTPATMKPMPVQRAGVTGSARIS